MLFCSHAEECRGRTVAPERTTFCNKTAQQMRDENWWRMVVSRIVLGRTTDWKKSQRAIDLTSSSHDVEIVSTIFLKSKATLNMLRVNDDIECLEFAD